MLLDEFPAWGRLESVEESLAYLAGFGIYFYIIAQDIQQLIKTYGENQTITANTHIQIGFAPNNPKSIKYLSEMTGVTTVVKPQVTTSGSRIGVFQKQVSTTYQEVRRQLMTEDEVMRMPKAKMDGDNMIEGGDMLIFLAGTPAIYGKQMPYFLDPILKARTGVDGRGKMGQHRSKLVCRAIGRHGTVEKMASGKCEERTASCDDSP